MPNINYYECCHCGIMTKQIEISQREVAAMQDSPLFFRACSLINVLNVGVFLIGHLVEKIEDTWLDNKEQKYYDI